MSDRDFVVFLLAQVTGNVLPTAILCAVACFQQIQARRVIR
jgi:hypothetical protein